MDAQERAEVMARVSEEIENEPEFGEWLLGEVEIKISENFAIQR